LGSAPTNANLNYNVAGTVVLLTNVYFGTNAGLVLSNANRFVNVTNGLGQFTQVGFEAQQGKDFTNRVVPNSALFVQGILIPFTTTSAASPTVTNGNYEIILTRWIDVVTNFSVTISPSGSSATINWLALPQTTSYSVLAAGQVTGPYLPLATGLKFSDTAGTYTDNSATGDRKFYRVTIP